MTDQGRILIVNPNSSEAVTAGIAASIESLAHKNGPKIEYRTLEAGPPAIESERDIEVVQKPLLDLLEQEGADASIIACFSDPGLATARERLSHPVYGIGESAFQEALSLGARFGILAILEASAIRHEKRIDGLGLTSRFCASLPIDLGVLQLEDEVLTFSRLLQRGKELRDDRGADVLILGCAGMARYKEPLQEALSLPIVEPCQAAFRAALGEFKPR